MSEALDEHARPVPAEAPVAERVPAGEWRRTSPLGFVVQGIAALRGMALPFVAVLYGSREAWGAAPGLLLPIVALFVTLGFGFSYLAWLKLRYRVGAEDIRVESGIVSRTARSVPYTRIQDVSLEQALVPRLFGLVEARFETGAGGKDELKLAYVSEAEGAAMRDTVRSRRSREAGRPGGEPGAAAPDEPPARLLFALDSRRLLTFGVYEFSLVVFAVLLGATQQFDFLLPFDVWDFERWGALMSGPGDRLAGLGVAAQVIGVATALALLGVVGLATGIVRTVLRDYDFRLEETPKGLRRRRGLLTRTDTVMPLRRVQALKLTTGIARRLSGWHGLEVISLAHDSKSASHVVAPFARIEEIAPVVEVTGLALPGPATSWRRASAKRYLDRALLAGVPPLVAALAVGAVGLMAPGGAAVLPLPALVLATLAVLAVVRQHFLWRHDRHALEGELIFVRRGWLSPRLDIAPRLKLQSVEIAQGPIARRRGYASLRFGLAGGALEIDGIKLAEAHAIRAAVLESIAAVDFMEIGRVWEASRKPSFTSG